MADDVQVGDLPRWLQGAEVTKLKDATAKFWGNVSSWLKQPLMQLDPITCHPVVLRLYAYEQDVERFVTEPDSLYRLRVATSVANTRNAGELIGMEQIVERFGEVLAGTIERDPDKDWDVITLVLENGVLTKDWQLGQFVIRQYGRTCRRYEFLLLDEIPPVLIGGAEGGIDKMLSGWDETYIPTFNDPTPPTLIAGSEGGIESGVSETAAFQATFNESVTTQMSMMINSAEIYRDKIEGYSWL